MKKQRGITLIALILTIVVLMILAIVAITNVNGDGIIERANEAKTKYTQEAETENQVLSNLLSMIPDIPKEEEPNEYGFYYDREYKCDNYRDGSNIGVVSFKILKNGQIDVNVKFENRGWEQGTSHIVEDLFVTNTIITIDSLDANCTKETTTYRNRGRYGDVIVWYNNNTLFIEYIIEGTSEDLTFSKNNIAVAPNANFTVENNGKEIKLNNYYTFILQ